MRNKLLILVAIVFFSCKSKEVIRYVPVKETSTKEVIIRDTVVSFKFIPYKDSIYKPDTVSFLENEYAYSKALFSSGRLSHSLGIKNVEIKQEIQLIEKIIKDSIPYPIEVTNTKIEYKKDFIWWSGIVSILLLFGAGIFKLARFIC